MHVFFQCVAEAVAEKGIRGLAELVPGGGLMFDIAKVTWEKYRQRRQMQQIRADVQQMAQAGVAQVKEAAVNAINRVPVMEPELEPILETFLAQIPAATRQSLKRADDPTGTTVPANFSLRGPEDVAKLLPPSLPRFKPGDPLPGKAGWLLEKQLGLGGFGEVWLARKSGYESLLGAVKFCRSLGTRDRDLLHESKVIDQLLKHGDHPNIVKLMDVHLEGNAPWLMYEYVEGGDLTDLIHQWSALPPNERQQKALAALQELAAAIGHFHRLDPVIVHRDLKPANILRDKTGRLRITDFGISGIAAKHMIENETRGVTTRAGRLQSYLYGSYTPLYASPQQKDGADPDPRDDVHALGVIGYQMLTGQVSQGVGPDFAQDLEEAGVSRELIAALGGCTAARADRRPQDARDVSESLFAENQSGAPTFGANEGAATDAPSDQHYLRARVSFSVARTILRVIGFSLFGIAGAGVWELILEISGKRNSFELGPMTAALAVGVGSSLVGCVTFGFLAMLGVYVMPDLVCVYGNPSNSESDEDGGYTIWRWLSKTFDKAIWIISYAGLGFMCGVGVGAVAGVCFYYVGGGVAQHSAVFGSVAGAVFGGLLAWNLVLGIGAKPLFLSWASIGPIPFWAYFLPYSYVDKRFGAD